MGDLSDDELLLMYREGDADAFDVLFDRYNTSVYNFARMMLNGPEAAEEVLQEVFMTVARAARNYKPRGHFRPWLMRIARNLCLNRLQSERLRREILAGGNLELIQPASAMPSPPEHLERDERMAALRRSIAGLPERQREAIVLYAFEEMSYREIAGVLEAPINTVKTLIHRARGKLARTFEAGVEEENDGL